jgi:hypothetical protein
MKILEEIKANLSVEGEEKWRFFNFKELCKLVYLHDVRPLGCIHPFLSNTKIQSNQTLFQVGFILVEIQGSYILFTQWEG